MLTVKNEKILTERELRSCAKRLGVTVRALRDSLASLAYVSDK
jgi:hypothetical protein